MKKLKKIDLESSVVSFNTVYHEVKRLYLITYLERGSLNLWHDKGKKDKKDVASSINYFVNVHKRLWQTENSQDI